MKYRPWEKKGKIQLGLSVKTDDISHALLAEEDNPNSVIQNSSGKRVDKSHQNNNHRYATDRKGLLTHSVLPEAIAKVDVIRDKAMALGWTKNGLYQTQGQFKWPCGQDYGLVCFLEKDERIGEVTRQFIEIIRPSGVRQRFYNRDVDHPWIKKVH